jgi:nitrite reductase/ring-hydroxylating ferredoxin subunit/DMSO/TMAO reductase YedYZ heme-binding membrane subunit
MTAQYRPVGWNAAKRRYDAILLSGIAAWCGAHVGLGTLLADPSSPPDALSLWIKALGSLAFLLLSVILCIGPAARLDPRLLPLLYNRRHLGVATLLAALAHALAVLTWHFMHDTLPLGRWLLSMDITLGQDRGLPFVPMGMAALLVMALLAATSHDFWLGFLRPSVWKALHMGVYAAYALGVGHFAFGALQHAHDPLLPLGVVLSVALVVGLHLAAARHSDATTALRVPVASIPQGRAVIVQPPGGERIAIFRHGDTLSAVSNVCSHQNGPIGEGCIVDGLITCPWHGFQFRPTDGRAPEPYSDRIATFRLRLDGPDVLVDPLPNPPGTFVEPLRLP